MKGLLRVCWAVWLLSLGLLSAVSARHIVGGELQLSPTNAPGTYQITMIQFWDGNTLTNQNRDAFAEILIYRKRDNALLLATRILYISSREVNYQNQACAQFRKLSTVEGTYRGTVRLPAAEYNDPEGYYMVWERCCRNDDLNNIINPGGSGMVFYLEFPPVTTPNHSPVFAFPNGDYICVNQLVRVSMQASDADGDELRYSLVDPLRGNTSVTQPIANNLPKREYPPVVWAAGRSATNSIPARQPLRVDPRTGMLSVVASELGLYVFAVQVEEFRNGRRIGLTRRDFQLLVIECNSQTPPVPVIAHLNSTPTELEYCPSRPLTLSVADSPDWAFQWQRDGQNITGATTASYVVQDTGRYTVIKSFRNICSKDTSSQEVLVRLGTPPPASLTASSLYICEEEAVELAANATMPFSQAYLYRWRRDGQSDEAGTATLSASQEGLYTLIVTDDRNGCEAQDTLRLRKELMSVKLPSRLSVQKGKSVELRPEALSLSGGHQYEWSPRRGLVFESDSVVRAAPSETTTYTLRVTSANGCTMEVAVEIVVFDKLYIPDAFSPNGDGINDTFEIKNGDTQIRSMKIFSRWGELIFQAIGPITSWWDGTYQARSVPAGEYIYLIETDAATYRGSVLLLH